MRELCINDIIVVIERHLNNHSLKDCMYKVVGTQKGTSGQGCYVYVNAEYTSSYVAKYRFPTDIELQHFHKGIIDINLIKKSQCSMYLIY